MGMLVMILAALAGAAAWWAGRNPFLWALITFVGTALFLGFVGGISEADRLARKTK